MEADKKAAGTGPGRKKYCSCYGQESEEYLSMVHKSDGRPTGQIGHDCGCTDDATGSEQSHHCKAGK